MRRFHLVLLLSLSALPLAWSSRAQAQVSDAERAAARDLFKQGDELQRAGKFPEALDKFQRAEQVIHAPTNVLRIAECQAATGRLVEAAESYRQVTHFTLSPTSPPAFQSAIDQAKGELAQVEPRVPKVTVQVTPPPAQGSQPELVIDGASVPFALVGEQIPLDPGTHTLQAKAAGYASQTETVSLKERDAKTVALKLEPAQGGGVVVTPPPAGGTPPPPPPYGSNAGPPGTPPPPPVVMETAPQAVRPRSNLGILIGLHLGGEAPTGNVATQGGMTALSNVSAGGVDVGLDAGLRFARHWYAGVSYDRAAFSPNTTTNNGQFNGTQSHSDTFGLDFAFIVNPDRVSFYGTLGLQTRIYTLALPNGVPSQTYTSGELLAGVGIWIPIGHWFRLLPELTGGFGSFSVPDSLGGASATNGLGDAGHAFFALDVVGYYNIDL